MRTRYRTYTFTVAEHREFGTLGFKPSWYPQGDPLGGMVVAHDILEHFPKDDGSAEGEYQALGAALYLRGTGGYGWNGTAEENIASDLPMIWGIQAYVRPCHKVRAADLLDRCREAVRLAIKEMRYSFDEPDLPSAESRENIARWIAKGYKRAERRYRRHSTGSIVWSLFKPIQDQADKALQHAEEGMVLTVRVNVRDYMVSVDLDYPDMGEW